MVDLRDFAMVRPAVVQLFPAPQLSGSDWTHPPGWGSPRASGLEQRPEGWGLPPERRPRSPSVYRDPEIRGAWGTVAPSSSSTGVTVGAWPSMPSMPTIDSVGQWWSAVASDLHKAVYQRAAGVVTGVQVPEEAADPIKARNYLAALLQQQAAARGWPVDQAAALAAGIRAMPPAGTVVATVDRVIAVGGPPQTWPGAEGWYTVARQLQKSAALVSAGETAGYLQRIPVAAAERIERTWTEVRPVIEEGQKTAAEISKTFRSVGTGIGVGAGAATALVGIAVVGTLGAWFFAPELAAGGRAVYAAKTAKDARRKGK